MFPLFLETLFYFVNMENPANLEGFATTTFKNQPKSIDYDSDYEVNIGRNGPDRRQNTNGQIQLVQVIANPANAAQNSNGQGNQQAA